MKYNIAIYLVFTKVTFQLNASNHVALPPFTRHSGHLIACDKFYGNLVRLYLSFTRNDEETGELRVFRNKVLVVLIIKL